MQAGLLRHSGLFLSSILFARGGLEFFLLCAGLDVSRKLQLSTYLMRSGTHGLLIYIFLYFLPVALSFRYFYVPLSPTSFQSYFPPFSDAVVHERKLQPANFSLLPFLSFTRSVSSVSKHKA